jgi:hypothetical protein
MTTKEARIVAQVVSQADGSCHVCVLQLVKELEKRLPGHNWRRLVNEHGADLIEGEERE